MEVDGLVLDVKVGNTMLIRDEMKTKAGDGTV